MIPAPPAITEESLYLQRVGAKLAEHLSDSWAPIDEPPNNRNRLQRLDSADGRWIILKGYWDLERIVATIYDDDTPYGKSVTVSMQRTTDAICRDIARRLRLSPAGSLA